MMRYAYALATFLVFTFIDSTAQINDTIRSLKTWDFTFSANVYLLPDEIYVNPVLAADYNHLHLESRYNYEDFQTGSLFGGYTFSTGNTFEFNATPMVGIIFGNTNGIAPGLLLDLYYWKLNFYSESEYLLDFTGKESSFIYTWSELAYAPFEWMWFGLAAQRTRLYRTDLDIQRGFTAGFSWKSVSVSGYIFNFDQDDPYGMLSIDLNF